MNVNEYGSVHFIFIHGVRWVGGFAWKHCMDNFFLWTEGLEQMMCALHMPISAHDTHGNQLPGFQHEYIQHTYTHLGHHLGLHEYGHGPR